MFIRIAAHTEFLHMHVYRYVNYWAECLLLVMQTLYICIVL